MLPQITFDNETELDQAGARAFHLRTAAAEMNDLADRMEAAGKALNADELFDLAAHLRDSASDNEAQALNLDEAIGNKLDRRRA